MEDVRRAIYEAKGRNSRSVIREQASHYVDFILEAENLSEGKGIPKPSFDLLIEILSVKELYEKPGVEDFMLGMAAGTNWLSISQKNMMYDAMLSNYGGYIREDFCWTICDFVARQFSFEKAFTFFKEVIDFATEDGKRGVYLGLDILYRYAKEYPDKEQRIASLLKSRQNR